MPEPSWDVADPSALLPPAVTGWAGVPYFPGQAFLLTLLPFERPPPPAQQAQVLCGGGRA